MKICSSCGATYTDRIDFCFDDGQVLQVEQAGQSPATWNAAAPDSAPAAEESAIDAPAPRNMRTPTQPPPDEASHPHRKRRSLLGRDSHPPGTAHQHPEPQLDSQATIDPTDSPWIPPPPAVVPEAPAEPAMQVDQPVPSEERSGRPPAPDTLVPDTYIQTTMPPDALAAAREAVLAKAAAEAAATAPAEGRPSTGSDLSEEPTAIDNPLPLVSPHGIVETPAPAKGRSPTDPPAAETTYDLNAPAEGAQARPAWLFPVVVALSIGAMVVAGIFLVVILGASGIAALGGSEPKGPVKLHPDVALHVDPVEIPATPPENPANPETNENPPENPVPTEAPAVAAPAGSEAPPPVEVPAPPSEGTPAPTPHEVAAPHEVAVPTPPVQGTKAPPVAARPTAPVKFESTPPGATVSVDGYKKGTTPVTLSLVIGKHTVDVEMPGYSKVHKSVTVAEGGTTVPVELWQETKIGKVFVAVQGADGRTLTVDGVAVGKLPVTIDLTEGTHEFAVEGPDGPKVTREVTFNDSGRAFINL